MSNAQQHMAQQVAQAMAQQLACIYGANPPVPADPGPSSCPFRDDPFTTSTSSTSSFKKENIAGEDPATPFAFWHHHNDHQQQILPGTARPPGYQQPYHPPSITSVPPFVSPMFHPFPQVDSCFSDSCTAAMGHQQQQNGTAGMMHPSSTGPLCSLSYGPYSSSLPHPAPPSSSSCSSALVFPPSSSSTEWFPYPPVPPLPPPYPPPPPLIHLAPTNSSSSSSELENGGTNETGNNGHRGTASDQHHHQHQQMRKELMRGMTTREAGGRELNHRRAQSGTFPGLCPEPRHKVGPGTNNVRVRTKEIYRVVYSDTQRCELERAFITQNFISSAQKAALSERLKLTERQVKIWFQNRRAKQRKQRH